MQQEIILLYPELLHGIQSNIHAIERTRNIEIITADDDYTIRREVDTALNEAVSRMQAYLFRPSSFIRRTSTDHATQWEEKSITLNFPPNWPPHCIDSLRDAVHNYIVRSVVFYFLSLSLPANDPAITIVSQQRDRAYNDINALINARLGGVHIHPTPFG